MKNFLVLFFILAFTQLAFSQVDQQVVWQKKATEQIKYAKFSADGNFIYCAVGSNIKKMDAKTGEFISTFDNVDTLFIYTIENMQLSNQGNFIVSTDGGNDVLVWDTQTQKKIKRIKIGVAPSCVTLTNDEKFLLIGTWRNGIYRYDLFKDKIDTIIKNNENIKQITINHDGNHFVTGSFYQDGFTKKYYDKLILWETGTLKQVATLQDFEVTSGTYGYRMNKFSSDDQYLGSIRLSFDGPDIFNLKFNQLIRTSDGRACYAFEFLQGTNYLLSTFDELNGFEIYDVKLQKQIKSYKIYPIIIESIYKDNITYIFTVSDTLRFLKMFNTDFVETAIQGICEKIYVNNGTIMLKFSNDSFSKIRIEIYNLLGSIFYSEEINNNTKENQIALNTNLPSGIYICKIISGNKEYSQKIEIVR